jgi:hypothetical protein
MNRVAFLVLITLALAVFAVIHQTLPPAAMPANAPPPEFSAERAMRHIEVIAKEPHPVGSTANHTVREYIRAELKNLGLETETQPNGNLENVLGRINGISSSDTVLLTAHLDSVAESFGATDDGSGVAVLLETARALMSGTPPRNTIMLLFTDDEESGLNGAKAFIANHTWAKNVKVVIGFDAGGLSGPAVLSTTSRNNGWLIRQLAKADPYLVGSSAINAFADSGTDFGHAFKPAGFSGYAFDLYWDRRIHTPADNLENVNLSSLQHQGYHALSLARHFGNLNSLLDSKESDRVYFSVLRFFTVSYSLILALILAILVTGLFWIIVAFGLRQKILSWTGMYYGMIVLMVGIVAAPLPGLLFGRWGNRMPLRYYGRLLDKPYQVAAIALLAVVLIVLAYFLAHRFRNTSIPNLAFGALLPLWIGMAGTAIFVPALSFVLTWPLLLNLMACANWLYWFAHPRNSTRIILGMLISGSANIIILGPTIILGLFDQMALTLLLVGVLSGFLIPQIYLILGHPIME